MSVRLSLLAVVAVAATASPAAAVPFAGIVNSIGSTKLVGFDSDAPGTITGTVTVTGLRGGDSLSSLDTRPATGELYALGATTVGAPANLYTINTATGVATFVATTSAPVTGSSRGFAFNPVVDAIRIVGENGENLRVNPVTGATVVDTRLAYAAGDANAGVSPFIDAVAYTNQDQDPATGTQLFGLDLARRLLVLIDPPNGGVLTTVGTVGAVLRSGESFDIISPTAGFITSVGAGSDTTGFNSIDLRTGAVTLVGLVPRSLGDVAQVQVGVGGGQPIPEPASVALVGLGLASVLALRRRRAS